MDNTRPEGYPQVMHRILANIDPMVWRHVRRYLNHPDPQDRFLLDGWARVGREDGQREQRIDYTEAAAKTMTPLGIACLVRYGQAFEDARELLRLEAGLVRSRETK